MHLALLHLIQWFAMSSQKSSNLLVHFCSSSLEGISLLGLSHISVNASMTVNDTALTSSTISRLEAPDPIDALDITICPADDILDGCKVRIVLVYLFCVEGFKDDWLHEYLTPAKMSRSCICVACRRGNWRSFGAS